MKLEESQERFDQSLGVVRQALAQLQGLDHPDAPLPGAPGQHLAEAGAGSDPLLGRLDQRGFVRPVLGAGLAHPTFPANQKRKVLRAQI